MSSPLPSTYHPPETQSAIPDLPFEDEVILRPAAAVGVTGASCGVSGIVLFLGLAGS